jgi:hypothetical protein
MTHKKGERVRHPTMTSWGLGEVVDDSRGDLTRVFFVGVGEKTISSKHVSLITVDPSEASHPVLDNLRLSDAPGIRYRSLPDSIQFFLERYPQGFYGDKFLREERNYKVAARELMIETLSEDILERLCESRAYSDVCARALKVVNATNLIFPNEKMALKDGLKSSDAQEAFSGSLFNVLFGPGPENERFEQFGAVLNRIGAGKWTTATYFLFLSDPHHFMFVKPIVTQNAAMLSGFEINYRPEINWLTYSRVLAFCEYLKNELADLKPRDMIDIQSFMWCIAPDT